MTLECDGTSVGHHTYFCYTVRTSKQPTKGIAVTLMSPPRQFLYRFPRFESRTRVDFISKDAIFLGSCVEISESGLRSTFEGAVPPGTEGLMTLYTEDMSFSAHAVILDVSADEVTARFQFHSPQEESSIREFIKRLAP